MKPIPRRLIANTKLQVSVLGLGTVKFGRNEAVKYPRHFAIPDDHQLMTLLKQASAAGINLLDTAPAYGVAQQRLGRLVGKDARWIICSKVGEFFSAGKSVYNYSEKATRDTIENSLRELRREALDIVLIHSDGRDEYILKETPVMQTLLDLKEEGKIIATGISGKSVAGAHYALQYLDLAMCVLNLADSSQLPVIEYARQHNKGIFIKKGLMSGHLSRAGGDNPLQASYDHIFAQPGISSLIIGTINPVHLQQNITALQRVMA